MIICAVKVASAECHFDVKEECMCICILCNILALYRNGVVMDLKPGKTLFLNMFISYNNGM